MPRPVDLHTCVALLDRIIPCKLIAQKPRAISQVHTESSPGQVYNFPTAHGIMLDALTCLYIMLKIMLA